MSQTSQHPLVIRTIAEVGTECIRFRVGLISSKCSVSRSTVYKVLWTLQMMRAVRHHATGQWSLVRARWKRGPTVLIQDYEWTLAASPITAKLLGEGHIEDARQAFRKE